MTTPPATRATRREWIGLAVIALPCLLYAMDLTVLNLAVPHIFTDLAPTSTQQLWIVDIYGFVIAGSLITMGTLGDRIGRRRMLLIGAAAFGAASVLAAFSTTAATLIASRAVLGVAGATLAPSTLSLIRTMFVDSQQRTFAIGVWAASFSAGSAFGPVLGGLVLEHYWWGAVFLLCVPVMMLLLALGPVLLPEAVERVPGRLDVASAAMALVAVLLVIYGLKQLAGDGSVVSAGIAVPLGAATGVLFVRRQRRLADPLIDLALFRMPAFSAALATYTLGVFVVFGINIPIAQYLQLALGLSPLHAGLWLLPSTAAFVLGSMLSPVCARWFRPAFVIAVGLAFASLGLVLLARISIPGVFGGAAGIAIGSAIVAIGLAPVPTLATSIVIGSAPASRAGLASGLSETCGELGGALGIALFGSLGTTLYRSGLGGAAPLGTDTLAGAVALAARQPGDAAWLDPARQAFVHAFEVTALVGAAILLATGVLAALLLRRAGEAPSTTAEVDRALTCCESAR
jgi:DHA2 family multidrug resistance protein-like MFS transporter